MDRPFGRAAGIHPRVHLEALGLLVGAQAVLHRDASGLRRFADARDLRSVAEPGQVALGLEQIVMGIDAAYADRLPDARRRDCRDRRSCAAENP